VRDALSAVYAEFAPELEPSGSMHPDARDEDSEDASVWDADIAAADGFAAPELREYEWALSCTPEQYTGMLSTMSAMRLLDPPHRDRLLGAVQRAIADHEGVLTMAMRTLTCIARAV
jgi:hypothetical protein